MDGAGTDDARDEQEPAGTSRAGDERSAEEPGAAMDATGRRPLPRRRDAARNRQRLLVAADELMAEKGMDLSFNELAHRAGVGVGTVYRQFDNRQALLEALVERRLEQVEAVADEVERLDPVDGVRELVLRMSELHQDLAVNELLTAAGKGHDVLGERMRHRLVALVERAQATGRVRSDLSATDFPVLFWMGGKIGRFTRDAGPDLWIRYMGLILQALVVDGSDDGPEIPPPPRPSDLGRLDQRD